MVSYFYWTVKANCELGMLLRHLQIWGIGEIERPSTFHPGIKYLRLFVMEGISWLCAYFGNL